jgi:hypothetical protein
VLHEDATVYAIEAKVAGLHASRSANLEVPAQRQRLGRCRRRSCPQQQPGHNRYLADMSQKLTPRQQAQQAWLDTLPPKFEKMKKIIELFSTHHADESQVRSLQRLVDELKAQGAQINLTALADTFGYMGMLVRRAGGHQSKARGLHELLAGARINYEGACREASNPVAPDGSDEPGDDISP